MGWLLMSIKLELLSAIRGLTAEHGIVTQLTTAESLAQQFSVQRNTVSHYLNQLVKENRIIKINTRPVIFFDKETLEKQHQCLLANEYASIAELESAMTVKQDAFNRVIGAEDSLYRQIRQLKSAAFYPGGGLPVLLTGPTGSGKSFLARNYYQYCVDKGILKKESHFIHFNCAEYADNPELLASSLFGYKRGAFTGATQDKTGLFDEADQGMLFLDEVHRLDSKGQEKLFGYLDNGLISPIGETKKGHPVAVRLVFATTEDIQSNFLKTFIRRIPVQIEIPSLDNRTNLEKKQLVLHFYLQQVKKVKQTINVSRQVISLLSAQKFESNVGQLQNSVILSVANALARSVRTKQVITVRLSDLPQTLLQLNLNQQPITGPDTSTICLKVTDSLYGITHHAESERNQIKTTFSRIIQLARTKITNEERLKTCQDEIATLCDYLVFGKVDKNGDLPLNFLKNLLAGEIQMIEQKLGMQFNGNTVVLLAHYFYNKQSLHWGLTNHERDILKELTQAVQNEDTQLQSLVTTLLTIAEQNINLPVDAIDALFLTLYFKQITNISKVERIRCLVLAHGYSTASSMANVVNKMVGSQVVDAFDMPIDISPQQIGEQINQYLSDKNVSGGLIMLVDMGSLEDVHRYIKGYIDFPIGIINNVSTQSVLTVASEIQQKNDFELIMQDPQLQITQQVKVLYPSEVHKNVIITCCLTGIGTAKQIKALLEESMPLELDLVINAYEYARLCEVEQQTALLKTYNVLAVIGTIDPEITGIPYISLENLINGTQTDVFNQVLQQVAKPAQIQRIGENILRNFSIERVINSLTILDARTVMANVDQALSNYCQISQSTLSNQTRMALYVHVSCLIERLIRNEPITSYAVTTAFDSEATVIYHNIQKAFSVVEQIYSVKIPDTELGYIFDIVVANH
ncbi:transcriptional regulator [Latilactobacillus curvatus]|nr:transcriptional regulator [Latilactobacillus curvatus]